MAAPRDKAADAATIIAVHANLPAVQAEAERKRKLYWAEGSAWRALVNARCAFDSATYAGARMARMVALQQATAAWWCAVTQVALNEDKPDD